MAPQPVEDAQAWEDAGHDPGIYVYLLRQRGELSPWWYEPLRPAMPYTPGAIYPSPPVAGGLVP